MTDIMEQQPKASSTRQEREAAFDAHVESNLKRNYISHFLHGMLGLTGFRLIYAPTVPRQHLRHRFEVVI